MISVKNGNNWSSAIPYVKDGGSWQSVKDGYTKKSGTWEKFFSAVTSSIRIYTVTTSAFKFGRNLTGSDLKVDWGDGNIEPIVSGNNPTHTYSSAGRYYIEVSGSPITGISFSAHDGCTHFTAVSHWKDTSITDYSEMFWDQTDLGTIANMHVGGGTNFLKTFLGCSSLSIPFSSYTLGNWDVSQAVSMAGMFQGCTAFNDDLSGWCVQNIATKPYNFDLNCTSWTKPQPVWGTCP